MLFLTNVKKYNIIVFNFDLEAKNKHSTDTLNINKFDVFFKCIHLKEEIGVFIYYENDIIPKFLFKSFEKMNIQDYKFSSIILSDNDYNNYISSNDLIKLNEKKICFSSFTNDKKNILISIISIFSNDSKYKIRSYSLKVNEIFQIYLYYDLRLHNYNNFISLGFSFCYNSECRTDGDENYHSVYLMILNYANSTDNYFDVYKTLIDNYDSNMKISDINIDLEKEVKINNNIFGYIFYGILVQKCDGCNIIKLISSFNKEEITYNYTLKKNESIKFMFIDDNFSSFNCNLQFNYIITEPDLNDYDKNFDFIIGSNETNDDYIKGIYKGKLSYYNIILNESLTKNCSDKNCDLCPIKNISFCIICKYNYAFHNITNDKICLDKVENIVEIEYFNRYLNISKVELPPFIPRIISSITLGNTMNMKELIFI